MLKVVTDNKWRDFTYRWDVPADILEREFDYQNAEEETDGFFRYRGVWYHLDQFMRDTPPGLDSRWNGWAADSFFSGVALEVSPDREQFRVATVFSVSDPS